jgi:hypothetical protein
MKMRRLWKVLIIVAVVLVALGITGWLTIDSLAKTAIQTAGSQALGVDTRVDSVSLHLFRGEAAVQGIVISNPPDCKTPHLMKTGSLNAAVKITSLFTDTVVISKFEIDDLDINIEQPKLGVTNVTTVLNNITAGAGPKPAESKEAEGKKFKIEHIAIRNTVAHIQVLPIGGKAAVLDVKVPEIVMDNVTSDNAAGIAMPELMRRLIPAILMAVVDKAKGIIPDADLKKLSGDISATTQALGRGAANLVKQAGGEAGKQILEGIGGATKVLEEPLKKGVGNPLDLLGGKKKTDAPDKPK